MLAQHPLHIHQWGAFVRWLLPEKKVPSVIVSTETHFYLSKKSTETQFHYNQKPVDCIETITMAIMIKWNYAFTNQKEIWKYESY